MSVTPNETPAPRNPKARKVPAPKNWNDVLAFLEDWRSQTHQITDGLKLQLEVFQTEFRDFRTEVRRDMNMFKNGGADFSQRLVVVTNDVKEVKANVKEIRDRVGALETKFV